MKLIACDKCESVVVLTRRTKKCRCGNISGKYVDSRNIVVLVKDRKKSRILGLQNSVRFGLERVGEAWIIPFDNETVTIGQEGYK